MPTGKPEAKQIDLLGLLLFERYCTQRNIDSFVVLAGKRRADLMIGVGGGRVLDLAKAVAETVPVPIVTVPTIAATCAAWSALSIIYNDSGNYVSGLLLKQSPRLILVDSGIIAEAPVRYLADGIADTLVKWYEAPLGNPGQSNIPSGTGQQIARLALDTLQKNWRSAVESAQKQSVTQGLIEVIDCIIMLAGLVGSIRAGGYRAGVAHPLHNSLTYKSGGSWRPARREVAFGLLAQFILEGRPQQEIAELVGLLDDLGLPVTLRQLGIDNATPETIAGIAGRVSIPAENLAHLPFAADALSIGQAIRDADQIGRDSLDRIS